MYREKISILVLLIIILSILFIGCPAKPEVKGSVIASPITGDILKNSKIILTKTKDSTKDANIEFSYNNKDWKQYSNTEQPTFNDLGNRYLYVRLNKENSIPTKVKKLEYNVKEVLKGNITSYPLNNSNVAAGSTVEFNTNNIVEGTIIKLQSETNTYIPLPNNQYIFEEIDIGKNKIIELVLYNEDTIPKQSEQFTFLFSVKEALVGDLNFSHESGDTINETKIFSVNISKVPEEKLVEGTVIQVLYLDDEWRLIDGSETSIELTTSDFVNYDLDANDENKQVTLRFRLYNPNTVPQYGEVSELIFNI